MAVHIWINFMEDFMKLQKEILVNEPGGKPGYLRVDTVHQGDRDGEKGVYINRIKKQYS